MWFRTSKPDLPDEGMYLCAPCAMQDPRVFDKMFRSLAHADHIRTEIEASCSNSIVNEFLKPTATLQQSFRIAVERASAFTDIGFGCTHLLLAFLQVDSCAAAQTLVAIITNIDGFRAALEGVVSFKPTEFEIGGVIPNARNEANSLDHARAGTGHVLLAMCREDEGYVPELLRERRVSAGRVLETARRFLESEV